MRSNFNLSRHGGKLLIPLVIVIVGLLIWAGYQVGWTDFQEKKLWDWLQLFIIPGVLGFGAILFNRSGQKAERARALDRQRQETLITYFDKMQDLLLEHGLRDSKENDEVHIVARARTISVLRNLDEQRIAQLLQFLSEASLGGDKLIHININEIDLHGISLYGVDLQCAELLKANLQWVHLDGANLRNANLIMADLQHATLWDANLRLAQIISANLQHASFRGANLQKANLMNANMKDTYFNEAKLQHALLEGANLQHADFKEANLRDASVTPEQLNQTRSLEGATMPDGSKYEDWLANGRPDWTK